MIRARFKKRILKFKLPAGTSRGILYSKPSWFIILSDDTEPNKRGVGECSVIPNLSLDNINSIELKLEEICIQINKGDFDFQKPVIDFPAINFGLETALLDLKSVGPGLLFPSNFTSGKDGILINGLIWMGSASSMLKQVEQKIESGYKCIKLKIGAIKREKEFAILSELRSRFSADQLEIRVDANGAFTKKEAISVLEELAKLEIHSIEQPIAVMQHEDLADLCRNTPIPIALDEELIGVTGLEKKSELIRAILPQFIILKPGLLGGFKTSQEWIELAVNYNIGWWVTSALESNIGLNAIAQWAYTHGLHKPQGLGTGSLFTQNISSPLEIKDAKLFYNVQKNWEYEFVY